MERQIKNPGVIFISPKVSEMSEFRITEEGVSLDSDGKDIIVKDASLSDAFFDDAIEYRNIAQLWHPAEDPPPLCQFFALLVQGRYFLCS